MTGGAGYPYFQIMHDQFLVFNENLVSDDHECA